MSTQVPTRVPTQSLARHRHQCWLQIYLPLILGFLIFFVVPILALILNPSPLGVTSSQWAAIAIIWLIAPLLVLSLLGLVIVGGLIYLLNQLTTLIPRFSWRILTVIAQLQQIVRQWADRGARPFIFTRSLVAGVRRGRELLLGRKIED